MKRGWWIGCGLGLAGLAGTVPLSMANIVIASFETHERLGVDWPRTLVNYRVEFKPGQAKPELLRLVDINGVEQPFQLSHVERDAKGELTAAWVSFYASLPATQRSNAVLRASSYHYELRAEKPVAPATAPAVGAGPEGNSLALRNSLVLLRMPKPGTVKFDKPLAFGQDQTQMVALYGRQVENGIAPGPIQGVQLVNGHEVGGSYFWASDTNNAPKVTGYTCAVTEQGPLFVEARIRYQFTTDAKYEMTVRVLADDPAVRIDEQYDFGAAGSMWQYRLMVSLVDGWRKDGWKPSVAYGLAVQNRVNGTNTAYLAKLAELGVTNNVGMSAEIRFDGKVFDMAVRYPWSPAVHFFGLVNPVEMTKDAAQQKRLPFLGVAPLHPGNWRGSVADLDAMLFSYGNGDVCLNWPLVVPPHPRSLLHTGEYDPDLPLTFGRRQWAIIGGTFQTADQLSAFRAYEGFVNLDDYKEWILDWPADPKVTYPRLVFSKADVQRLKPTLDKLPGAEQLKTFLYFHDTPARRSELWGNLISDSHWQSPYGMIHSTLSSILARSDSERTVVWNTHYRYSQMAGWVGNMDELLSSDELAPAQRAQLRADLAGLCHLLTEPDMNPRGSMTHLGNPSMPMNRFYALPWTAALIPDHPQAKTWLDLSAKYLRYKLAMNVAPGGAWSELMTYYAAGVPHNVQTATVLAQAGRLDEPTARLAVQTALFPTHLLTPRDPRFGARIVPGWGHEGVDNMFHFLVAAVVARQIDPALATALVWSWDQCGRSMNGHHDAGFSQRAQVYAELLDKVKPGYVPPQLASSWLPGFGATMRAHAGDPNETYLSIRNGYLCSHSDANQGDFVLYAKGAPLITESLYGYAIGQGGPFDKLHKAFGWPARPRFGNQQNEGGWPGGGASGGIPAHTFTDSTDYLRAVGDYGPNRWTRQIAFMKGRSAAGPSYFVFRDSFDAANGDPKTQEQKWWYWRTLGPKEQLQATANELTRTSAFGGVKLTAHFLQPASITAESRDATQEGQLYSSNAHTWLKAGSPVVKTNNADSVTVQETMTVTAVGPLGPNQDVLVALYPQAKDEAGPKYESLGDGAAKIITGESTDYVFLDRPSTGSGQAAMKFSSGDVSFEGVAGTVRVYPNEVHLIISEGPGSVTYKGATLRSVEPAVKIIKPGKAQVFNIPTRKSKLKNTTLPEGCRITGDGVCELKIENDRILGKSESNGAFLFVPMPAGMKVLPMLVIDGQTYAAGTTGNELIIPLLEGEHTFEMRALEQPPISRNWQAWP